MDDGNTALYYCQYIGVWRIALTWKLDDFHVFRKTACCLCINGDLFGSCLLQVTNVVVLLLARQLWLYLHVR